MKSRYQSLSRQAFSLVELSIVLVILGLLVGGILAGQSLIRAAEVRSLGVDHQRMLAAGQAFKDKYFAIPGDIKNATTFWGSKGGNGADSTCGNAVGTGTATCNGDGDGTLANVNSVLESFLVWQHLANAGLIQGSYIGTRATNAGYSSGIVIGVSTPQAGRLTNVAWLATYGASNGDTFNFAWPDSNRIQAAGVNASQVLTPAEAWNIDTKYDDGKPATGTYVSFKSGSGGFSNCTDRAGLAYDPVLDPAANYNLGVADKSCGFYLLKTFY